MISVPMLGALVAFGSILIAFILGMLAMLLVLR